MGRETGGICYTVNNKDILESISSELHTVWELSLPATIRSTQSAQPPSEGPAERLGRGELAADSLGLELLLHIQEPLAQQPPNIMQ